MGKAYVKYCPGCETEKPIRDFGSDKRNKDGKQHRCRECVNAAARARRARDPEVARRKDTIRRRAFSNNNPTYAKDYARKIREEALAEYGGKCVCCGEENYCFLTFDHVGGWGAAHRRERPYNRNIALVLRQEGYPKDGTIRILCHNCNSSVAYYGFCPHGDMLRWDE